MNNMDEISYWVYTKRAPCLMNYDNQIKKQFESAQDSKNKSDRSITEGIPSPKKKKRKLSLLDDENVSQKQQNVYFEASQHKQRTVLSSCKSGTLESDIDFNIKKSSIQDNPKKMKIQKNGRTLHKKNKVVTSTPLRRSLRRVQNSCNLNCQSNMLEVNNCAAINGNNTQINSKHEQKASHRSKKNPRSGQPNPDRSIKDKKEAVIPNNVKPINQSAPNGQFEDLSDVSGFTANYIRSTKVHSNVKSNRNLRSKGSRNLIRESQQNLQKKGTTMLVCVNKSVNTTTELPQCSVLNCSTDSSQNVIHFITKNNNEKVTMLNKSTSLLRFVETTIPKIKDSDTCVNEDSTKIASKTDLDISFQSQSTSNSRYPKRHKNRSAETIACLANQVTDKKQCNKKSNELNCSDRKENPEIKVLTRTRSGRNSALALRQPYNSVSVYDISTEQVSSVNTMNVASPRGKAKSKHLSAHKVACHRKKSLDKSGTSLHKNSVREKSGFSACFSDSDDDSEALKQRQFFC